MKRSKNSYGQSYVETVFCIPLFIIFLVVITWTGRIFITKILLDQAARHGVFLIAYFEYDPGSIKNEIINYLQREKNFTGNINPENITVYINYGPRFEPSSVYIKYKIISLPALVVKTGLIPGNFYITAYSECFTGTHILKI